MSLAREILAWKGKKCSPFDKIMLVLDWNEDRKSFEFLHDEKRVGTFACVYRGRVGLGDFIIPVAIKLQRDQALTKQDRAQVTARFDQERKIHRGLQGAADGSELDRRPIVRQLDVWPARSDETYQLPPCIVCPRARHALAPLCPEDGTPLVPDEFMRGEDDRCLRCRKCDKNFPDTGKEQILAASVQKDPACLGCAFQKLPQRDKCLSLARFLNFFPSQLLIFELLDLDLEDYLRWRTLKNPPNERHEAYGSVQAFEKGGNNVGTQDSKDLHNLFRVTDIFSQMLEGVEYLHKHDVIHLDLKPANLCLRFKGPDLVVKVIDLGLAEDRSLPLSRNSLRTSNDFIAPEIEKPSHPTPYRVKSWFVGDKCMLLLPQTEASYWDPLVCAGDILTFEDEHLRPYKYRVSSVGPQQNFWQVFAVRESPVRTWSGEPQSKPTFPLANCESVTVEVEKTCGYPADVFSLGMILLALLAGDPDVGPYRKEGISNLQRELKGYLDKLQHVSGRAIVEKLRGLQEKHLQIFYSYIDRLPPEPQVKPLALELLGIVIKATLRGDGQVFYLNDRGSHTGSALEQFRRDVETVRGQLRELLGAPTATQSLPPPLPADSSKSRESILVWFLKYSHHIDFRGTATEAFLECWPNPWKRIPDNGTRIPEVLSRRVEQWKEKHQDLYRCWYHFKKACQTWAAFFTYFSNRVLEPCDHILGRPWLFFFRRQKALIWLRHEDLQVINEESLEDAVKHLEACIDQIGEVFEQRKNDLRQVFKNWRNEFGAIRNWVTDLEDAAKKRWNTINRAYLAWIKPSKEYVARLRSYLAQLKEVLFQQIVITPGQGPTLNLQRQQRDAIHPKKAKRALDFLCKYRLGPGFNVEAAFAIQEFEELRKRQF